MNVSKKDALPVDVLNEIFKHCVPSDPLKYKQPNVKQAPMLLGHICSFWRDVAFQNPYIWTHLYYLAMLKDPIGKFDARDIVFLNWWIPKAGGLSPSLRLAFKEFDREQYTEGEINPEEELKFTQLLMGFIANAKYLNLDLPCRRFIELNVDWPLLSENLNTLVMRQTYEHGPSDSVGVEESEKSIPVAAKQSLRRLFLEQIVINEVAPIVSWSRLTHIHAKIILTRYGWFSLLRACDDLEYGLFDLHISDRHNEEVYHPLKTLPRLKQLAFKNDGADIFQPFLFHFHLPALVGLRINAFMPPSVEQLHGILSSTPALRELHLGIAYTAQHPNSILIPGDLGVIPAPLRTVVPELRAIHFEGSECMLNICKHDREVVRSVFQGEWLQLGKPGNKLRRIHLGHSWDELHPYEVMEVARDIQSSMPTGVTLSLRPYCVGDLSLWAKWEDKYHHFTDEFESLSFDEGILNEP